MRTFDLMWLLDSACKAAVVLLLAWLLAVCLRHAAASARHRVWWAAMVAALSMPALSGLLPGIVVVRPMSDPAASASMRIDLPVAIPDVAWDDAHARHAPADAAGRDAAPGARASGALLAQEESVVPALLAEGDAAPPAWAGLTAFQEADRFGAIWSHAGAFWARSAGLGAQVMPLAPWIWLGGALFSLLPLALGWWSLLRLQRRSQRMAGVWPELLEELKVELGVHRPVVLLQSGERSMPMTWGALPWRPAYILLPKDCSEWSQDRRRAVLLHELAHIGRWDCLTQTLAHGACALYWFNPLVWYGAHRMLIERERACDDQVLGCRTRASDYAEHLLSIARSREGLRLAGLAGIAMARRGWAGREGGLDGRVLAILDAHRQRAALGRLRSALLVTLIGAITLPVAMLQAGATADVMTPALARIELDPAFGWRSSHWAGNHNTWLVAEDLSGATGRFHVLEPGRRHVWTNRRMVPIDAREQYPILVMRYRARGTHPDANSYVLWVDDGTGPSRGGLRPVRSSDLIADGEEHEIRRDMREVDGGKISGDLTWLALGVHCGEAGPAEFELVSLAFEADPEAAAPPEPQVRVRAEPIRVQVQDPEGNPIAGAAVVLDPLRLDLRQVARTDAQGRAVLVPWAMPAVSGLEHYLQVSAEGKVAVWKRGVTYGSTEILVLNPARTVTGVVVDEQDQPVAGAAVKVVTLQSYQESGVWQTLPPGVITDAQGRWRWEGLPVSAREVTVAVLHPEYVSLRSVPGEPAYSVALPQAGELRMTLAQGWRLTGRVVNAQGQPIEGATVFRGQHARVIGADPSIRTDRDGRFHLGPLPASPQSLSISAAGYALVLQRVEPGHDALLEVVLSPGEVVRFRVVDDAGQPLAGAYINLDRSSFSWSGRTDAEGRAVWEGAPQGPVMYEFGASGYRERRQVERVPSETEHVISLSRTVKIHGAVTDAKTGQPIEAFTVIRGTGREQAGAPSPQVNWERWNPLMGQAGRYEVVIGDTYPFYQVRIEARGYRPGVSELIEVAGEDVVADLALEPAEPLIGQVQRHDGEPVVGATLLVLEPGQRASVQGGSVIGGQQVSVKTDGEGRFTLDQVDLASIDRVGVVHPWGYADLQPVDAATFRVITLQPWARIEGHVQQANEPLAGAVVRAGNDLPSMRDRESSIHWQNVATADAQGRFVLERLPVGEVMVAQEVKEEGPSLLSEHVGYVLRQVHRTWVSLQPGELRTGLQIGGLGRQVTGRVVWPGEPVAWEWAFTQLVAHLPMEQVLHDQIRALWPEGFEAWDPDRRRAWLNSEAGKPALELWERYSKLVNRRPTFVVQVERDGRFQVADVPAGSYQLRMHFGRTTADATAQMVGQVEAEVTVPDMPEGRSDEPLDIGDVTFVPAKMAP